MKFKESVVLSLGTNQGDKLGNILFCIQLIKEKIGEINMVSKLYETPAWGFESAVFYNCALEVLTNQSPLEILRNALSIELEMGRTRSLELGYQSRIIDIDLVFYGEEVIQTDELQLPHPLMQKRKFVLMPVFDLNKSWKHPVLGQTIVDMLEQCEDESDCVVVQDIDFV